MNCKKGKDTGIIKCLTCQGTKLVYHRGPLIQGQNPTPCRECQNINDLDALKFKTVSLPKTDLLDQA